MASVRLILDWLAGSVVLLFAFGPTTQAAYNSTTQMTYKINVGVYTPPFRQPWTANFMESPVVKKELSVVNGNRKLAIKIDFHIFTHHFRYDNITMDNLDIVNNMVSRLPNCSFIVGRHDPFVQLVADYRRVPYIATSNPVSGDKDPPSTTSHTFRMQPTDDVLQLAVQDVVSRMMWVDIAILYDTHRGLDMLGRVIESPVSSVRSWKLSVDDENVMLRDRLLDIRQLNIRVIIVACVDQDLLSRIFAMALRLSMLSHKYSWLVADMNAFLLDYELYNDTQVNFTTFNLVEPDSLSPDGEVRPSAGAGGGGGRRRTPEDSAFIMALTGGQLKINKSDILYYAVVRDSVALVRSSIETWLLRNTLACPPNCSTEIVLPGDEIADIIRQTSMYGVTGQIVFNSFGRRYNNTLRIMSMSPVALRRVGMWYEGMNTTWQRLRISMWSENKKLTYRLPPLGRQIVKIVTLVDPPFVMLRADNTSVGNDRWEGFLIDLIAVIAKELKFKYELYEVPDGSYGGLTAQGEWNGMIKELIVGNASMCLGAISITSLRETVVDFTKPFKQKKFNLLMRQPTPQHSFLQFLWPFSSAVWFLILSSIIVVSLFLFVMDRISPNSGKPSERFTFGESLFFIYGTLVGPGTNNCPRTMSGRILAGAWWFFCLILLASYTANLAAFLTVTRIETPIKTVADLASQRHIKYGTVKNTYASSLFSKSELPLFKKMWQFMGVLHPESMVDNTTEGIRKVREGDYAFIWDDPINRYIAMNECDLMSVGEPFDERGYGIGVPMGASYRDDLTMVILALGERGEIKKLEDKWWTGGKCEEFKDTTTNTEKLELRNVAGVFFVMSIGVFVALCVCLVEFIVRLYTHSPIHANNSKTGNDVGGSGSPAGSSPPLAPDKPTADNSLTML